MDPSDREELWGMIKDLEAENKQLRKALQGLYDEQNGPPLLRHKDSWQKAMDEASKLSSKP